MKKNSLIGSKITFVLGVIILVSSVNKAGETTAGFIIGNMMMFGSLAYMARRKQSNQPSTKWLVAEIISIIIILYFTILGIIGGGWYNHPLPFMIAPICFAIVYIFAFRSGKKTNKTLNTEIKQENKEDSLSILEKLSDLKKKGIITEEDFNKKKKQILGL